MIKPHDSWQVEIDSNIYQTDLEELKNWIRDRKLQPTDKVRMSNLSWIEAHKVLALRNLFDQYNPHGIPASAAQSPSKSTSPPEEEKSSILSKVKLFKGSEKPDPKKDKSKKPETKKVGDNKSSGAKNSPAVELAVPCILSLIVALLCSFSWVYLIRGQVEPDAATKTAIAALDEKLKKDSELLTIGGKPKDAKSNEELKQLKQKNTVDRNKIVSDYQISKTNSDFWIYSIVILGLILGGYFGRKKFLG